jgi:hypothetical protein
MFNTDHTRGQICHDGKEVWHHGKVNSLTLFVTDQILIVRLLADRQGCMLHSAGVILNGKGLLFVGHSEAGKTTATRLLEGHAEVLCDDRNIVRRFPEGFRVYGTWSHGESPLVSPASAPLGAIMFLRQSTENRLTRLTDRKEIMRRLLPCLIRAVVSGDWWSKTLEVVEVLAREASFYEMEFDKSGKIVPLLREL